MNIQLESEKVFNEDIGDVMTLNEFVESVKANMFMDDDGFIGEVLLNKKVIVKQDICPSDQSEINQLLKTQEQVGTLEVVWYNR